MNILTLLHLTLKGGTGSGNFGHSGVPGKVGGSSSTGGTKLSRKLNEEEEKDLQDMLERSKKYDPSIGKLLLQKGKILDSNDKTMQTMKPYSCHHNSAVFYSKHNPDEYAIETGFAHKPDKIQGVLSQWVSHSWIRNIKTGELIETTGTKDFDHYFGVRLSKEESEEFINKLDFKSY